MAGEIFVEEVSADRSRVTLRVMNMRFVFIRKPGDDIKLVSKSKLEAQVYDPDACWVPKKMFIATCQMAAAILARPITNQPRRKR